MALVSITSVVKAAASTGLVDLPTAKDELNIPLAESKDDGFIRRAILQISAAISNYCNRVFQVETLIDTVDVLQGAFPNQLPVEIGAVQLARWPVVAVTAITEDGDALTEGKDFRVDRSTGLIYRLAPNICGDVVPWVAARIVVEYLAGCFADQAVSGAVPASTPYAVTSTNAASVVFDRGVKLADGTSLTAVTQDPGPGEYAVAAGIYSFNAAQAGAGVTITNAYQKMPDDLIDAALRLLTARYQQRGRDPMLMERNESAGSQRFWVGTVPGQNGAFPPEIQGLLDNYRVPVTA